MFIGKRERERREEEEKWEGSQILTPKVHSLNKARQLGSGEWVGVCGRRHVVGEGMEREVWKGVCAMEAAVMFTTHIR